VIDYELFRLFLTPFLFQAKLKSRNQFGFSPEAMIEVIESKPGLHDTFYQDDPFRQDLQSKSQPLSIIHDDLSVTAMATGTTPMICSTYLKFFIFYLILIMQ